MAAARSGRLHADGISFCLSESQHNFACDEELPVVRIEAKYLVRLVGGLEMDFAVGEFIESDDEDAGRASEYERIRFRFRDAPADDVITFEETGKVHRVVAHPGCKEFSLGKELLVKMKNVDNVRKYNFAGFDSGDDGYCTDGWREIGVLEFGSGEIDAA